MIPAFDAPPLRVEEIDEDTWRLIRDLGYMSAIVGRVIVPEGFVTDFESVPRVLPIAYALVYGHARREEETDMLDRASGRMILGGNPGGGN